MGLIVFRGIQCNLNPIRCRFLARLLCTGFGGQLPPVVFCKDMRRHEYLSISREDVQLLLPPL